MHFLKNNCWKCFPKTFSQAYLKFSSLWQPLPLKILSLIFRYHSAEVLCGVRPKGCVFCNQFTGQFEFLDPDRVQLRTLDSCENGELFVLLGRRGIAFVSCLIIERWWEMNFYCWLKTKSILFSENSIQFI